MSVANLQKKIIKELDQIKVKTHERYCFSELLIFDHSKNETLFTSLVPTMDVYNVLEKELLNMLKTEDSSISDNIIPFYLEQRLLEDVLIKDPNLSWALYSGIEQTISIATEQLHINSKVNNQKVINTLLQNSSVQIYIRTFYNKEQHKKEDLEIKKEFINFIELAEQQIIEFFDIKMKIFQFLKDSKKIDKKNYFKPFNGWQITHEDKKKLEQYIADCIQVVDEYIKAINKKD